MRFMQVSINRIEGEGVALSEVTAGGVTTYHIVVEDNCGDLEVPRWVFEAVKSELMCMMRVVGSDGSIMCKPEIEAREI